MLGLAGLSNQACERRRGARFAGFLDFLAIASSSFGPPGDGVCRIGLISRRGCAELPAEINHGPLPGPPAVARAPGEPMPRTIAAFDRIGEENAFAVLARATALSAQGRDIVNLGIGQPDFST